MKRAAGTLALLLCLVTPGESFQEPGWIPLFNGKDFSGWKLNGDGSSFSVMDGAIVADGDAALAVYDGDVGNHDFKDFDLAIDVLTKPNSNGGIFFHTEFLERGHTPRKGFEAQVNNSFAIDPLRTGSLYRVRDVTEQLVKDDEWFTEEISVRGQTITIRINGKEVVNWTQPADWAPANTAARRIGRGTIALQAHNKGSVVHYKNIRIRLVP